MPTKFDFVSPGIELREIDQSAIAPVPEQDGMLLIGRAKKGPAMKPIKINSISNFHQTFGTPMDGVKKNDPWRQGNTGAGGWAAYAAEAYLAANVGPVKFIRLAGLEESSSKLAGWNIAAGPNATTATSNTGAMGLFVSEVDDSNILATAPASLDDGLLLNNSMLANGSNSVMAADNETGHIVLEIQYLDLADPTASIKVVFFDGDGGNNPTPTVNQDITIDLDGRSLVQTQDELKTELDTYVGNNSGRIVVTQSGGTGTAIEITMSESGGSGNTRTITATGALSGATLATAKDIIAYDSDSDGSLEAFSSRTFSGGASTRRYSLAIEYSRE